MKIALVNNDDFSMYHFRKGLIRELVKRGFNVSVIVPPGKFNRKLEALGVRCITVAMERFVSPLKDILLMIKLFKILNAEKFDVIHNMTIKPNIYGTIAASLTGVRHRICLVAGSGFVYLEQSDWKINLLKKPILWMYKFAMSLSHKVWFQNNDDLDSFVINGIIPREKGVVIRGSGVNIDEYRLSAIDQAELAKLCRELNIPLSARCVLMVTARMIWSKGVKEFIEAAAVLREKYPDWYFIMICPKEDSPDSVPENYILSNKFNNLIIIDTFRYDIINFIAISDIMVLPSYYPEGVPRTLLEGLAMSKPIVTTDHQGCRETVDDGVNGYLIPVKNVDALIEKLAILMKSENLRNKFGGLSREKAELEFSEEIVVGKIISDLYELT